MKIHPPGTPTQRNGGAWYLCVRQLHARAPQRSFDESGRGSWTPIPVAEARARPEKIEARMIIAAGPYSTREAADADARRVKLRCAPSFEVQSAHSLDWRWEGLEWGTVHAPAEVAEVWGTGSYFGAEGAEILIPGGVEAAGENDRLLLF